MRGLNLVRLDDRIVPVVGAFAEAPIVTKGTGLDGVVLLIDDGGSASGSLLYDGRHVLTAAHVVDENGDRVADRGVNVHFDLPGGRITMFVPPDLIAVWPKWTGTTSDGGIPRDGEDLAVLTLPALAPGGPRGADRYDLYRNNDELSQSFTVVGYGRSGIGNDGSYVATEAEVKRSGFNTFDTDRLTIDGIRYAPNGRVLNADFDSGSGSQDSFDYFYQVPNRGFGSQEASTAPGDSGGPALISVNGEYLIAGVSSYYLNGGFTDIDRSFGFAPTDNNSFGDFFGYTRISSYAASIDQYLANPQSLILDLTYQPIGNDGRDDTISISQNGGMLSIWINGELYSTLAMRSVSSLAIIGSQDRTIVNIDASVDGRLAISNDRVAQVTDSRPATPIPPAPITLPPVVPFASVSSMTVATSGLQVNASASTKVSAVGVFASGADFGSGPRVAIYNPDGSVRMSGNAYEANVTGGVRIATGDVTGDGIPDLITAPGPGMEPLIKVFDGLTGAVAMSFLAYEGTFTGGVFVAAGDITGDGIADIFTSPDQGGGPRVRIFSGRDQSVIADFLGIEDTTFRGGARLGLGDINHDGTIDLLVGAGFGGGPRLAVFDGASLKSGTVRKLFADFFIFEPTLRNGVYVTSGDIDGDGFAEVIVGGGPGGVPRVFALSGKGLLNGSSLVMANFFAGDPNNRSGVRIVAKDLDADGKSDLVVGAGEGAAAIVTTYSDDQLSKSEPLSTQNFQIAGQSGFGGVFVG